MKTILVMGGFARSGKTSSLSILQNLGISYFSTSILLDNFIEKLEKEFNIPIPEEVENRRQHKIKAAENVLVPIFGRQVFSITAARAAMEAEDSLVTIESIGGEEWDLIAKAIGDIAYSNMINYRIHRFNVRSKNEKPGVDIRQLLKNATTIQNDGTLEDLANTWKKTLEEMGIL
jgi:hypothetical protein